MYSCNLYLTLTLDGVGVQRHASAVLPPRKSRYSLYSRLVGPQGRSGRVRKISPTPGFDPQTVQRVATSCCTDNAMAAHKVIRSNFKIFPEFADKIYKNSLVWITAITARGKFLSHKFISSFVTLGMLSDENVPKSGEQSRQCSSTPVGFGQRFLSNEQFDNTASP